MRRLCHTSSWNDVLSGMGNAWEGKGVRGRERNGNNLWHRKASQIPDTRTRRAQNKECRIVADANSSRGIAVRGGRLQGESESGSFSAQLDGRDADGYIHRLTPSSTVINRILGSPHTHSLAKPHPTPTSNDVSL